MQDLRCDVIRCIVNRSRDGSWSGTVEVINDGWSWWIMEVVVAPSRHPPLYSFLRAPVGFKLLFVSRVVGC